MKKVNPSLDYIDTYPDFYHIAYYFERRQEQSGERKLSESFQSDIDFQDLFRKVDYTESNIGKQYLYNKILTESDSISFDRQEQWIEAMTECADMENKIAGNLELLTKHEAFYIVRLFLDLSVSKPFYYKWVRLLSLLPLMLLVAAFWNPVLFFVLVPVLIVNILIHYHNKNMLNVYQDSIPQLPLLMKCVRGLLESEKDTVRKQEVSESLARLARKRKKMMLFLFETKSDDTLLSVIYMIFEYLKIFFLIEPLWTYDVLDSLEENKEDTALLFSYAGSVDNYLSVLRLRRQTPLHAIPQWSDKYSAQLSFKEIYHPLITDCVVNDLDNPDKSILLTGSNMAGKTSFIRTIALNVLLSRSLNFAFAKEIFLSGFRIYSLIRVTDDLSSGSSFFLEEVKGVKKMIDISQENNPKLFLMDELFKGTNTIERIASAKAVLSYLAENPMNQIIISTHDVELADHLSQDYDLYHFAEDIRDNQIHFDYKLKKGVLTTRNAIRILQLYNFPQPIVDEAMCLASIYQKNR